MKSWALYPWFEENGPDLVHPEDIDRFRSVGPFGKVFAILGDADGFTKIAYGEQLFRVKPLLLQSVPAPKYGINGKLKSKRYWEEDLIDA